VSVRKTAFISTCLKASVVTDWGIHNNYCCHTLGRNSACSGLIYLLIPSFLRPSSASCQIRLLTVSFVSHSPIVRLLTMVLVNSSQVPRVKGVSMHIEYSRVCYNERSYNERMLQRTVFIGKIRMLQRAGSNTIGRRSTRVRMTCRAFPLWLERQSSSLLSFVRFNYQFSSVICAFSSDFLNYSAT